MKILHVVKKYPRALGGDAIVVANLRKQQLVAGHSVAIVTSNCDEIKNRRHIYKFGLKDTAANLDNITIKRLISLLMLFFQMFAILRKERPDIVHTHSIDMAFFVSFAARWYHIPTIHTFHIVTFYDAAQSVIRRKSELWLARHAKLHRITAPNKYDVKKLRTAGLKQTALLPNGVNLALWQPYGYTEKNKTATFIAYGRLEAQKGYEYLIKAVALLVATQPIQVIIVGEGSQKTKLLQLIDTLHVSENVKLVGRKSPEQIRTFLAQAHAAIFPSLYETTPLTLLETWAAGTPAIATPVGILRDVSTNFDAALVVPLKDEHALAAAMQRYIEDEHLREAVAAAGYDEAEKYAWPHIAQLAERMYRGIQ